jgi:hypothetical protein
LLRFDFSYNIPAITATGDYQVKPVFLTESGFSLSDSQKNLNQILFKIFSEQSKNMLIDKGRKLVF